MVGVAQLVERRVVVADVAGSSPVTHPSPLRAVRRTRRFRCRPAVRPGIEPADTRRSRRGRTGGALAASPVRPASLSAVELNTKAWDSRSPGRPNDRACPVPISGRLTPFRGRCRAHTGARRATEPVLAGGMVPLATPWRPARTADLNTCRDHSIDSSRVWINAAGATVR
jgi:hypothetical protein